MYLLPRFTRYFEISRTKYVSSVCNVATILWVKYKVRVILFLTIIVLRFFISTFGRMQALSSVALCFRYVMKCFQGLLFRYYLNEFQMIPFSFSFPCTGVFSCYIPLLLYTYNKVSYLKKKFGFFSHHISTFCTVMSINSYIMYFHGLLSPVFLSSIFIPLFALRFRN
jgi:hypothetical protein